MDYLGRCASVQQTARAQGLDVVIVSASSDMTYLCGYVHKQSDRATLLVIPATGDPFLVAPALEAMKAAAKSGGLFKVITWEETESAFAKVRANINGAVDSFGVSEQTWAWYLLALQEQFPGAKVHNASPLITALRVCKSPAEAEYMRLTGRAADGVAELLRNLPFAGQTEAQVANAVISLAQKAGLDQASCILASGPNSASPHHSPGGRVISAGEAVWMDFGGVIGNYKSDVTRSVFVGAPPAEYVKVYGVVRKAQETAAGTVRTGMACQDLDWIARRIITEAGYGQYFIHRTGHGIGLDGHEHPYMVEGNKQIIEPGMCFSVEPGVYIPGKFGVRIEDCVCMGADGRAEILNVSSHDLFAVK
jgi:D-alanyl-D-alanine dipeptidase